MPNRFLWETIRTEQVADCKVFSVARNVACVPGADKDSHNFYVVHSHDWVNVIPVTADGNVVMVEQFRHGTGALTLEIPGGMVDPLDAGAQAAAKRELLEETGFTSDNWVHLGRNHPNPALLSNVCDTFLARDVERICEPSFTSTEYVEYRLVPLDAIPDLIRSGKITHSLVLVAFYYLNLFENPKKV